MVTGMPVWFITRILFLACASVTLTLASPEDPIPSLPTEVSVPAMKTSIYVGSVTLKATPFQRAGDTWSATYTARVFPWAFWSERGDISLAVSEADVLRLLSGETVEFVGEGKNHKGKPRTVTGRATPDGAHEGRIKVRIGVDDVELVFDGTYTFR